MGPMNLPTTRANTKIIHDSTRPTILHLGHPIKYNTDLYHRLQLHFNLICPEPECLTRPEFIKNLKAKTWGDFSAIMRPYWNNGNEMSPWDRELIELLPPSMMVMASAGAGFDWVKVKELTREGILYCNGAGVSTESVADMALYHIIDVFRLMTWSASAARSNDLSEYQQAHREIMCQSCNPRGHTLGIVGLGNIGFEIAKKVHAALGMRIVYNDVARKPMETEKAVDATFYSDREEMLTQCDCILLATPGGPPILTSHTLALLPRGARVVNIARGSLIDENALAEALESGHISAAGLDVHMDEPYVSRRLCEKRNVLLTSHTGGSSLETVKGFEALAMENVERVLNGESALTAVNPEAMERRPMHRHVNGNGVNGKHRNGFHTNGYHPNGRS